MCKQIHSEVYGIPIGGIYCDGDECIHRKERDILRRCQEELNLRLDEYAGMAEEGITINMIDWVRGMIREIERRIK